MITAAVASASVVVLGATVLAERPSIPRDLQFSVRRPPASQPLRVTVVGTSLSSPSRYGWPDQVATRLADRLGQPVHVRRITLPGGTSDWGMAQASTVLATDPDVVLVELAVNDADVRHQVRISSSVAHHETLLRALRSADPAPTVVLLTMSPASGPRSWTRPFLSRYYATYVDLARSQGAGLVDLYPRWLALTPADRELVDGLHPSDAAATAVIVDPVVDALAAASAR